MGYRARAQVHPLPESLSTQTPPVQETVTDPERLQTILAAVAALRGPGVLRLAGRPVRVTLERVDPRAGRLHWRCEAPDAGWGAPPYDVEVEGYNSVYRMRLPSGTVEADRCETPLPERLERIRHRRHRRLPAPPSTRIHLPLPSWPARERDVLDVSFGGLALRLPRGEQLEVGGVLQPLALVLEDGETIHLSGQVRHVSPREDGTSVCGLQVEPRSPADAERWTDLVMRLLCPPVRTDGTCLEPLWDLFIESGYFSLAGRSAEWFAEQRASFLDVGRRAARVPQLLCLSAWTSARSVEATFGAMKPYSGLWLIHQLAKRQGSSTAAGSPGCIPRDLYVRTVEHAQADPHFRWLAAYIEATVPFIHRTHVGFAQRVADPRRALVLPLRMIDVECSELSGLTFADLDIGPATASERTLLAREISRTRPACYVDALDFGAEALEMESAARQWREAGLERERHLLVARRGGTPLAAAVLELGQRGTNPFLLLDAARLFPLAPEGRDAFVALLDAARRWYASKRRATFVFMREDGDTSYAAAARLHEPHDGAQPALWLLAADLVPEFLEHIHEQTVGRLPNTPDKEQS